MCFYRLTTIFGTHDTFPWTWTWFNIVCVQEVKIVSEQIKYFDRRIKQKFEMYFQSLCNLFGVKSYWLSVECDTDKVIDWVWTMRVTISGTILILGAKLNCFRHILQIFVCGEYVNDKGQSVGTKVMLWLNGVVGKLQW